MRRSANYSYDEVVVLVEEYEELTNKRDKLWLMVRLLDLEQAVTKLPAIERNAVVLCGFLGLSTRLAGTEMGKSHETVRKHYLRGLDRLTKVING